MEIHILKNSNFEASSYIPKGSENQLIGSDEEGQLFLHESTLIWAQSIPHRVVALERQQIISACFTNMTLQHVEQLALVVLTADSLLFYFEDGQQFVTNLPFTCQSIWRLSAGIMLERLHTKDLDSTSPTLAAIFHPLEQFQFVQLSEYKRTRSVSGTGLKYVNSFYGKVVLIRSSDERGEMVTFCNESHTYFLFEFYLAENGLQEISNAFEYEDSAFSISAVELWNLTITPIPEPLSNPKIMVLYSNEDSGLPIIWILHYDMTLRGYPVQKASRTSLSHKYSYSVLSACSVYSTRDKFKDIFMIFSNGSMWLWAGSKNIIPCSLTEKFYESNPNIQVSMKRTRSVSEDEESSQESKRRYLREYRVVNVKESARNQIFLFLSDQKTSFKGQFNFKPESEIVVECLKVLSYCLPEEIYQLFWRRLLIYLYSDSRKQKKTEWQALQIVLLSFLQSKPNLPSNNRKIQASLTPSEEDWNWMMSDKDSQDFVEQLPLSVERLLVSNDVSMISRSNFANLLNESKEVFLSSHKEPAIFNYIESILYGLFILYECLAISVLSQNLAKDLGAFLRQLAFSTGFSRINEQYFNDAENIDIDIVLSTNLTQMDLPIVKFLDWVNLRIKTKSPGKSVLGILDSIGKMDSNLFHGCDLIRQISEFYNLLYSDNDRGPANIVNAMVRAGFKSQDLESLMIGVALPLREALFSCKFSPSVEICSSEGFDLIGRKDLAALSIANTRSSNPSFRDIRNDLSEIVRLRFSCDSRIDQVDKIFNAAGEDSMDAEIDQNMPAEEVSIIQQSLLKKWSSKAFAVSLGRAMFLFESSNIVVTEIFDIPKLKTAARLPPVNSLIEISTSALPNLLDWPEFHVGVAAGLRIRQDCPDVDSSWITFNQPKGSDGKPEVDSKHAGFLLGLGLNGHLKKIDLADSLRYYLLPQHEMVSQGLLLGLGASFMATRDNKITQMLSIHVPSMLPSNSTEIITASNTRTAAIVAYGLVHLGSNSRHQIEKILNEFEQSHMQGLEPENENRQCFIVGCAFSLGFVVCDADLENIKPYLLGKLLKYTTGIDSNITGIGSRIAIGLVALKSSSSAIASKIALPSNEYLLDFLKPEHILIQTISRYLILWDTIEPSTDWIQSQIPLFIKKGVADWIKDHSEIPENEHILHSYLSIVAGLAYCIGLKYAGTCFSDALQSIKHYFNLVDRAASPSKGLLVSYVQQTCQAVARNCQNVLNIAASMVMAGSGNLIIAERIMKIGAHVSDDMNYGAHLSASMSLGLLFLGSGTCTLGNSNLAIVSLLCSCFPIFPSHPSDNRYHLQALRHLWVLALERRCLVTRNIVTSALECVPVEISFVCQKEEIHFKGFTPIMLPSAHLIKKISILGPRYWPIVIDEINFKLVQTSMTIAVQRKTKYLSYMEDPHGSRGISACSFSASMGKGANDKFINIFSSSPDILAFAQYFCSDEENEMTAYCIRILYDCMTQDKLEMIGLYMWIYQAFKNLDHNIDEALMNNLRLIFAFYKPRLKMLNQAQLVNGPFFALLQDRFEQFWSNKGLENALNLYLKGKAIPKETSQLVACYVTFHNWPSRNALLSILDGYQGDTKTDLTMEIHHAFPLLNFMEIDKIIRIHF